MTEEFRASETGLRENPCCIVERVGDGWNLVLNQEQLKLVPASKLGIED